MDYLANGYRLRILGDLQVFSADGTPISVSPDPVMKRLLIALALRSGQPRRIDELVEIVWAGDQSFGRDSKSLETPVSRLRNKLGLPIPQRRGGHAFYKLALGRHHVDALDFIDAVQCDQLDPAELTRLMSLWRGDPRVLYAELPSREWEPLMHAVDRLTQHIVALSPLDLRRLDQDLYAFGQILTDKASAVATVRTQPAEPRYRLLIVENEVKIAKMLETILFEYRCIVATSLEEATTVVSESLMEIDAAVIDLHLTEHLDSAGLEILSALRDQRPDLPRLLITASPPPGSQEQMRKTYGLFDILIKGADGYSANGVRDTVGQMFSESEVATRSRMTALFESRVSQIQRKLMRQLVVASRGVRLGKSSAYEDQEHCSAQVEQFETDSDQVRKMLSTAPTDGLAQLITEFVTRWSSAERETDEVSSD